MSINAFSSTQSTSYLFVDGASLRHSLNDISAVFFDNQTLEVNWNALRDRHRKVFYYDAIPVQHVDEDISAYSDRIAPKQAELAVIERQPGYHVKTGDVQRRRTRGNEQKMVDVQLAVDALQAASRGLFAQCALITGDLDFRPLITALVDMGVDVTLHYPQGHTNKQLLSAADDAMPISVSRAARFLSLTDAQRKILPRAFSDHQTLEQPPEDAIEVWEDPNYGRCFIVQDGEDVRLVTERCPYNPETHRFVLRAKTMEHLRRYAEEDGRKLSLP